MNTFYIEQMISDITNGLKSTLPVSEVRKFYIGIPEYWNFIAAVSKKVSFRVIPIFSTSLHDLHYICGFWISNGMLVSLAFYEMVPYHSR